jgi:hypothetical protein
MKILEIGIGGGSNTLFGGNSLKMWASYFPFSKIIGIDIYDKSLVANGRIFTYQGSQTDAVFLSQFEHLDLIIDDGSHINSDVIFSFEYLFPRLKSKGFYAIEDVSTSFWAEYGGDEKTLSHPSTIINYFRDLSLYVNHFSIRDTALAASIRKDIRAVLFYPNLILIQKA